MDTKGSVQIFALLNSGTLIFFFFFFFILWNIDHHDNKNKYISICKPLYSRYGHIHFCPCWTSPSSGLTDLQFPYTKEVSALDFFLLCVFCHMKSPSFSHLSQQQTSQPNTKVTTANVELEVWININTSFPKYPSHIKILSILLSNMEVYTLFWVKYLDSFFRVKDRKKII